MLDIANVILLLQKSFSEIVYAVYARYTCAFDAFEKVFERQQESERNFLDTHIKKRLKYLTAILR